MSDMVDKAGGKMIDEQQRSVDNAIRTLAVEMLHQAVDDWSEDGWEVWLPNVGEGHYERIEEYMKRSLASEFSIEQVSEAHRLLMDLAEKEER